MTALPREEFRTSAMEFAVWGVKFRVWSVRLWGLELGSAVWGLGFLGTGFGYSSAGSWKDIRRVGKSSLTGSRRYPI